MKRKREIEVKYIETVGTGLNELFDACANAGLRGRR